MRLLGFDWTRTKDFTRREIGESIFGSRISSQGIEAASATPAAIRHGGWQGRCEWKTRALAYFRQRQELWRRVSSPRLFIIVSICWTINGRRNIHKIEVIFQIPTKIFLFRIGEGKLNICLSFLIRLPVPPQRESNRILSVPLSALANMKCAHTFEFSSVNLPIINASVHCTQQFGDPAP